MRVHFLDSAWVQNSLENYGYAAIFLIVMLESASVPLPGETILVSAAVYAGADHALNICYIIAAAAAGAILGDNIGFWVGWEFGAPLLSRWGHLVGLDARKRALGQYLFRRHGGKIVFFGRFIAPTRVRRVIGRRERSTAFAIFHLQRLRRNCMGNGVWAGRLLTWRGNSSSYRAIGLGSASSRGHLGGSALEVLQETRRSFPG